MMWQSLLNHRITREEVSKRADAMILVLDFGSQYTQLIAKRLRRLGYATEVLTGKVKASDLKKQFSKISGVIFSGSPSSVGEGVDPDPEILDMGVPILGLCFGYQFLAQHFGGTLISQATREYGAARVQKTTDTVNDDLLSSISEGSLVWMSHGDSVAQIPPTAKLLLTSGAKPAAFSIPSKKIWGLQFHPEVHHTREGEDILKNFAQKICRQEIDWKLKDILGRIREELSLQLKGVDEVYCAVSGGVDSTVLAVLLSQVAKVKAIFVDHGFLRSYERDDLERVFSKFPTIQLDIVDARERFWAELEGVFDPEEKRKIIGRLFIESFYSHIPQHKDREIHLGQGTIYSDVIESAANELASVHKIKSHHNVGGLPENLKFTLVEPLRKFFKDEVREIGALMGIDSESLERHPFPGPGLAIRCVGALTRERISTVQRADKILYEELRARNLYMATWQAFCVLLPFQTVGVMGDGRSYESVLALRAVSSLDAMTAEASELPLHDLKEIASRIVNEVPGINRVVYDLTSKPPGTIEWE